MESLRCVICKVPHQVTADGPELVPQSVRRAMLCTNQGKNEDSRAFMGGGLLFLICDTCINANAEDFVFYLPVPENQTRMVNAQTYKQINDTPPGCF